MEQEGRGKRSANKLQGAPVQDQAIRSAASEPRLVTKKAEKILDESYQVIIRYEKHAVRGMAESSELGSIDQLLRNDPMYPLDTIRLKRLDSGEVEDMSTKDAKAVF